jgi:hypothetical protein
LVCPSVTIHYSGTTLLGSGVTRRQGSSDGVRVQLVSADLSRSTAKVVHAAGLEPDGVTSGGVVAFAHASPKALITVNGDYFTHGVPRGPLIDGTVLHMDSAAQAHPRALVLDGTPAVQRLTLVGQLRIGSSTFPVAAVNSTLSKTGVLVFTKDWQGAKVAGYTFTVGTNTVVVTGDSVPVVAGAQGRRSLSFTAQTATGVVVRHALGVGNTILIAGQPRCAETTNVNSSRVAVGWSADGKELYVATAILNRDMAVRNRGLTSYQLAQVLQNAGASDAVLLDGGGSTAMIQGQGTRSIAYTASRFIRPTVTGLVISSRG